MSSAVVLGAGLVGSVLAELLSRDAGLRVTVADASHDALNRAERRARGRVRTVHADLSVTGNIARVIEPFDLVLGALPSVLGMRALRAVAEGGKRYCDISFMEEDAAEVDDLARQRGAVAVVDCGVAPGMSNILAAREAAAMDRCDRVSIYVGGLPRERRLPFEYKAGFSPRDVIAEYVRPARQVENGRVVVREALSGSELLDFPGVGTLEAFNTDGLRTLARTLDVPDMQEKTLRYPGHRGLMLTLREMGLFGEEPVEVAGGGKVRPIDVCAALLFPKWSYGPGEADLTVMRVRVEGGRGGRRVRVEWDLLDFHDAETDTLSMARTTALPCAVVARAIANGRFAEPGVHPPERIASEDGVFGMLMEETGAAGVRYRRSETAL